MLHRDDVVVVIIPGILNLRHHGLLLVIDALGGLGLLPCVVQGRQHQARQNGDDRDNDEQFGQGKFFMYLIHASTLSMVHWIFRRRHCSVTSSGPTR